MSEERGGVAETIELGQPSWRRHDFYMRLAVAVEGGTLYTTLQPCFNCLKEIMQVGIRAVLFRRPWEVRHPDYGWVEGEYERLVEHFRGRGGVFARLAQEEALAPVEVELGRPA